MSQVLECQVQLKRGRWGRPRHGPDAAAGGFVILGGVEGEDESDDAREQGLTLVHF
jgi:hypothetical protein